MPPPRRRREVSSSSSSSSSVSSSRGLQRHRSRDGRDGSHACACVNSIPVTFATSPRSRGTDRRAHPPSRSHVLEAVSVRCRCDGVCTFREKPRYSIVYFVSNIRVRCGPCFGPMMEGDDDEGWKTNRRHSLTHAFVIPYTSHTTQATQKNTENTQRTHA